MEKDPPYKYLFFSFIHFCNFGATMSDQTVQWMLIIPAIRLFFNYQLPLDNKRGKIKQTLYKLAFLQQTFFFLLKRHLLSTKKKEFLELSIQETFF